MVSLEELDRFLAIVYEYEPERREEVYNRAAEHSAAGMIDPIMLVTLFGTFVLERALIREAIQAGILKKDEVRLREWINQNFGWMGLGKGR